MTETLISHDDGWLKHDLPFHKREWKVEMIGSIVIAVFLLAGLVGLLGGSGPVSRTTAGEENSDLWVEYNRFERYQANMEFTIYVRPTPGGITRVSINNELASALEITDVEPKPYQVERWADRTTFMFRLAGTDPVPTEWHTQATRYGLLHPKVRLEQEPPLSFTLFIFP